MAVVQQGRPSKGKGEDRGEKPIPTVTQFQPNSLRVLPNTALQSVKPYSHVTDREKQAVQTG